MALNEKRNQFAIVPSVPVVVRFFVVLNRTHKESSDLLRLMLALFFSRRYFAYGPLVVHITIFSLERDNVLLFIREGGRKLPCAWKM